jgi:hypothetical protein
MGPIGEQFQQRLASMSSEEKAHMRRTLTGEDKNDLLRREDVYNAIRKLRTDPVPSVEFQKALTAVMRAIGDLPYTESPASPWQTIDTVPVWEDDVYVLVMGGDRYIRPEVVRSDGNYWRGSCPLSTRPTRYMLVPAMCTCLTELEDDAYGPGGPMSGEEKPPRCTVHPKQDGKVCRYG